MHRMYKRINRQIVRNITEKTISRRTEKYEIFLNGLNKNM